MINTTTTHLGKLPNFAEKKNRKDMTFKPAREKL